MYIHQINNRVNQRTHKEQGIWSLDLRETSQIYILNVPDLYFLAGHHFNHKQTDKSTCKYTVR